MFSRGFLWSCSSGSASPTRNVPPSCAARGVEEILESLRIADLAFDVNLLVSLKQRGYTIKEVPIEWTDQSAQGYGQPLARVARDVSLSGAAAPGALTVL